MANKIQLRRGVKANLPVLSAGEPAFTTDTKQLFIGDGTTNTEYAKKSDIPTSLKSPNALTVQFNGATNKTYDGSSAQTVNITPSGIGAYTTSEIDTKVSTINTSLSESVKQISDLGIIKANEVDLDVERARINSFTSLSEGSTTGDAELADGRIGADGITYANIGDSIRNQSKNIKDYLYNALPIVTYNNDVLTNTGKYIDVTGILRLNKDFSASEMIEIPININEIVIEKIGIITTGCGIAFYTDNSFSINNFISGIPVEVANKKTIVSIPSNAKYIAFSARHAEDFYVIASYKNIFNLIKKINDKIEESSVFKDEYMSILGDSISTFEGYIPSENDTYYPNEYITDVEQTWWKQLLNKTGMKLSLNNSWSGSRVCSSSITTRVNNLSNGVNSPNHIIIEMGINDFKYPSLLGDYNGKGAIPTSLSNFANAYSYVLNNVRKNYPNAKIYCCTIMQFQYDNVVGFPMKNSNGEYLSDFNLKIKELANIFGCEIIDMNSCGINYYNLDVTCGDGRLHPNPIGTELMFREAIKSF